MGSRDGKIANMEDQIRQLEERIANLEKQLETAMATGDEATKELRD